MAHFARIDDTNKIREVIVVANAELLDDDGNESEALGQAFIASLGLAGTWLQTSYNGNFRGNFAGLNYTYDVDLDGFIPPKPFESWVLDETTWLWTAPVPYPEDGQDYTWDETAGEWVVSE